jgi:hypothetical protein
MESRLALGGGALLLALGIWNLFALQGIDSRLSTLESSASNPTWVGASSSEAAAGSMNAAGVTAGQSSTARGTDSGRSGAEASSSRGSRSEFGSEDSPLDLDDPEAREALAVFLEDYEEIRKQEKREQGVAQYLDYVSAEAEAFAEENGVDDSTMGEIISIIETGTYEYVAIEHAAKDGEMDWSEAKPQLKAIREEGKASLQALLGEEAYDEFEARVWGSGRD